MEPFYRTQRSHSLRVLGTRFKINDEYVSECPRRRMLIDVDQQSPNLVEDVTLGDDSVIMILSSRNVLHTMGVKSGARATLITGP